MVLPLRWVVTFVWVLAMLSCAAAVFILLRPLGAHGGEFASRASFSIAVSTVFALILGIIALILTARVSSSDYKAEQETKTHTAELLASLRSIIAKGALGGPLGISDSLDLDNERKRINKFLSSTTAFAFWSWEAEASKRAGKKLELWRLFFIYLLEILGSKDPGVVINRAVEVEKLITSLRQRDILRIAAKNSNLARAIPDFERSREHSVTIASVGAVYGSKKDPDLLKRKLLFLKDRGVNDPDVDLFLGVIEDRTSDVKSALDRGANPKVKDTELLLRHSDILREFSD